MQELRSLVQKVGPTGLAVLIQGETGVGKEVVARELYYQSQRGPFVTVDCGLLAHSALSVAELFGHEKGSFTGALETHIGLFEAANGGTVFLDEIGELPLDMQTILLRVLQEKEIRRLGSTQIRTVAFRIIAATNRPLAKAVEDGKFREDLFFRLDSLTIRVPPLRERPDDIGELAAWFLNHDENGTYELTCEVLQALRWYHWPGNVRQLRNYVERLKVLSSGGQLRVEDLPFYDSFRASSASDSESSYQPGAVPGDSAPRLSAGLRLRNAEFDMIHRALEVSRGDRTKAASLLGIGRTTLYRRLKDT